MEIIRESRGISKNYAPLVLELYETKKGSAKPVKNTLERLCSFHDDNYYADTYE